MGLSMRIAIRNVRAERAKMLISFGDSYHRVRIAIGPLAMPAEIGMLWPIIGVIGQKDPVPFKTCKALSRHTLFDKFFSVYDNLVTIG